MSPEVLQEVVTRMKTAVTDLRMGTAMLAIAASELPDEAGKRMKEVAAALAKNAKTGELLMQIVAQIVDRVAEEAATR